METKETTQERFRVILRTALTGIAVNALLAGFKVVVGSLTHSIAITLDGINNIADAGSSIITVIAARLAGKAPDRKHPFGYGRLEYFSSLVIALLILYAGISSLREAIDAILHPETAEYSTPILIILAAGVVAKLLLGIYVKRTGERIRSDSLVASGEESRLDACVSAATVAAALVYLALHISLEAYLAAVISLLIIKAGFETLMETVSKLLGEGAEAELVRGLKATVNHIDGVQGTYDVVLNNYGPDMHTGSLHVAVADSMTADEIDTLQRTITDTVLAEHQVQLTAVSIYAINAPGGRACEVRNEVARLVMAGEHVKQMHGFYFNEEKKQIRFDLVVSFDAGDRAAVCEAAVAQVREKYPDYDVQVALDMDYNEIE